MQETINSHTCSLVPIPCDCMFISHMFGSHVGVSFHLVVRNFHMFSPCLIFIQMFCVLILSLEPFVYVQFLCYVFGHEISYMFLGCIFNSCVYICEMYTGKVLEVSMMQAIIMNDVLGTVMFRETLLVHECSNYVS